MAGSGLMGKGVPAGIPPWMLWIKIAIIGLSLVILALAAWSIAIFNSWVGYIGGYSGVGGLLIFVVSVNPQICFRLQKKCRLYPSIQLLLYPVCFPGEEKQGTSAAR